MLHRFGLNSNIGMGKQRKKTKQISIPWPAAVRELRKLVILFYLYQRKDCHGLEKKLYHQRRKLSRTFDEDIFEELAFYPPVAKAGASI